MVLRKLCQVRVLGESFRRLAREPSKRLDGKVTLTKHLVDHRRLLENLSVARLQVFGFGDLQFCAMFVAKANAGIG